MQPLDINNAETLPFRRIFSYMRDNFLDREIIVADQ